MSFHAFSSKNDVVDLGNELSEIIEKADELFIKGRWFKKYEEWMAYVNDHTRTLPQTVKLAGEAELLFRVYDAALEKLGRAHKPGLNLVALFAAMAALNPLGLMGPGINLLKFREALADFRASSDEYRACYVILEHYSARTGIPEGIALIQGYWMWKTVGSQYPVKVPYCAMAGYNLSLEHKFE